MSDEANYLFVVEIKESSGTGYRVSRYAATSVEAAIQEHKFEAKPATIEIEVLGHAKVIA
jgi:hypothetical protein